MAHKKFVDANRLFRFTLALLANREGSTSTPFARTWRSSPKAIAA